MLSNVFPDPSEQIAAFLRLAERLDGGQIEEAKLAAAVTSLPVLTHAGLEEIADLSLAQAHINPQLGWAIARVANETAVVQQADGLLQAKAKWYLGRALNSYFLPREAVEVFQQAKAAFIDLGEEAWVAACDWQEHVLAWAKPNLHESAIIVQTALEQFSKPESPLAKFRYPCCLTLAYIHTLMGNYSEALNLLEECEIAFGDASDSLNLIRCQFVRGNILRRRSKFAKARDKLENCIALAKALPAPVEVGLALNQLANVFLKIPSLPGTYAEAEETFLEGSNLFKALNLTFWEGLMEAGVSNIYINRGELSQADRALSRSYQILLKYDLAAPLADVLINLGWLETYRANYEQGVAYLEQALNSIQQLGNRYLLALCLMHLGEIYLEMGRYQQSLHYIERGVEIFQSVNAAGRLAECSLRLARCWSSLGRPDQAAATLDVVEENAREADQRNIFPYLYMRKAENFFVAENQPEALGSLQKAILAAEEFGDKSGIALAKRLLGEALTNDGASAEAAKYLGEAEKAFNEIGMVIEQAACQIAWGQYFRKMGDLASAQKAYQRAANTGKNLAPDIIWQAEAGLAALAEDAGNDLQAMVHYRGVIAALVRLRQGMWQPALAGFLLKRPIDTLKKALRLAVKVDSLEDILNIIEVGKAQVVANLFKRSYTAESNEVSTELANLGAEIRWRQEKARVSEQGNSWFSTSEFRRLRLEIQEMVKAYDQLQGRVQRKKQITRGEIRQTKHEFDLDEFREAANRSFGENWLALDFFLTETSLTCVLIGSQICQYEDIKIPGRVRLMLAELDFGYSPRKWGEHELEVVGKWLLPEAVVKLMRPDTKLFIAPYGQLHRLPWAALFAAGQPLVSKAVPIIVPSMQSLAVLLSRPNRALALDKGLLVAVSDFNGRHRPLPKTVEEVESLYTFFPNSKLLINEKATWDNLMDSIGGAENKDFSFLHIASHAFADKVSGRLSGLAFYERDVWLDELWDCAPLPSLITLSACSGSASRLYEGDEQVGLATTCLAAGAQHVIASLWPIQDDEAAELMVSFYSYLHLGSGVAEALALAQRAAIRDRKDSVNWAGFRCTGLPI